MDIKAFAKINLGLDVLCRRDDGYHEVSMIMQSLSLCDELSLRICSGGDKIFGDKISGDGKTADGSRSLAGTSQKNGSISLSISGQSPDVPADERNIIYKAARLFMDTYGINDDIEISTVKHIPSQAGLGGGSADAAAVLRGLNELFSIGASEAELCSMGLRLGADVPFCVMGGTALSEGIGEKLTRLKAAPQLYVLLAKPTEGISTADIYRDIDGSGLMEDAESSRDRAERMQRLRLAIESSDTEGLCKNCFNIFEAVTADRIPYIMELKERLMSLGAAGALMSGSGPTVYGLFRDREEMEAATEALQPELHEGRLSHLIKTGFCI